MNLAEGFQRILSGLRSLIIEPAAVEMFFFLTFPLKFVTPRAVTEEKNLKQFHWLLLSSINDSVFHRKEYNSHWFDSGTYIIEEEKLDSGH